MTVLTAEALTSGRVTSSLALLTCPLSLWGGLDLETGMICDANHPQHGLDLAGRVLAMTAARGSSSSSSALVEAVRRKTAPAAIILSRIDPILVIGSLVAADLYGIQVPILLLGQADWIHLADGALVNVNATAPVASLSFGEMAVETGDA
jgi:predicted aconitase with swiveling domain